MVTKWFDGSLPSEDKGWLLRIAGKSSMGKTRAEGEKG